MANAFNKGDVVVMKSGGPPMTVDKVPGDVKSSGILSAYDEKYTEYRCEWFKGATKHHGLFGQHLEKYVPPKK